MTSSPELRAALIFYMLGLIILGVEIIRRVLAAYTAWLKMRPQPPQPQYNLPKIIPPTK